MDQLRWKLINERQLSIEELCNKLHTHLNKENTEDNLKMYIITFILVIIVFYLTF